ncbi:MAG TPA: DUF1588 domain-containing protein [Verrucomicrobiales bacterium]|nr:DUF1588 domain-containing protein [Verrucomicrobiales bacterium]
MKKSSYTSTLVRCRKRKFLLVIEPDIRGAKTGREQLEKHRQIVTCVECNRKIDPLGFALEKFDAIGNWRT